MQKHRKATSHRGVLYCAGAAALLGALWLISGLFRPRSGPREVHFCRRILSALRDSCRSSHLLTASQPFKNTCILGLLVANTVYGYAVRSLLTISLGVQAPNDMAHSQSIGHEALRQYADYHLDHLGPYFPSVAGKPAVIPESKNFKEFVNEMKRVLDRQQLPERAFDWIFSPHQILSKPRPNCGGVQTQICSTRLAHACCPLHAALVPFKAGCCHLALGSPV